MVRVGIEHALALARTTISEAYELVQEAASHGWDGVVQTVQAAHDSLEVVVSNLDTAQDAADKAVAGVADIRSVLSTDEIAERLAGVIGEAAAVRGALDTATAGVEEAYARSRQAEANRLTNMISGLLESLDAARRSISDAKDAVEKEHQEAIAWGARRGGGSTVPSPQPTPRWPGYPPLAAVPLSWSDRMHILYGDELRPRSGGHLHGVNRPGKTEFPRDWDEDMITREVADVARRPDRAPIPQFNGTWIASGVRRGVSIDVIVRPDGTVKTGYPVDGHGVKRNPE